ncbi:efflux RND transporter periplasmic adaptor subunit [Escherichia coli]|nr:efflux RND transporter periplasmic adaptor subunit [Escherichia coli]
MNRRRKLLIPLLFCGAMLTACDDKSAENAAAMTPEVGVVTLSPGSVNVLSELPGRTVPYEVAEIRPQVGGIIIKRNFIEGDKVNQGDSLYQIDPAPLQAELNSAKGSLAKALSTASNARITFNRQASLLKTNYVSRQDYDTARTQLNEAEANVTVAKAAVEQATINLQYANVTVAKAAVEQATINLQYANVTSPITGVSGKSSVTVGALVTANQADSLVTVQRLDPIYVDLTQSVQDFLRMKEEVASGQIKQVQGSTPVQLNLENGKRYSQTGTLKFSDPTVDETTGSVTLRAIFPNPNGDLLPGMYVTALVDEGSRQNVLLVPQEGVTHNAQGKATALILDKDDVVQLREIEASKAIGDQWVVTSGLQAGDRVIVSGLQRIRPGIKARAISSSQENASTESKQ